MTIEISSDCKEIILSLVTILLGSYGIYFKYSEVLRDRISELKHFELEIKNKKKGKKWDLRYCLQL